VKAVVFDLNGTLVDDIAFHYDAWRALAERHGVGMTPVIFQSMNGLKNEDILPRLFGRPLDDAAIGALAEEKEQHYRRAYRPHVAAVAGADALFVRLRARGVKLALASSAPADNRVMVLERLGWTQNFDAVIASEGLPSKPAPDIFLEAARRLEVDAIACLAFEDAVNGVRSARAAGMTVAGMTTNVSAEELRAAGASFTLRDFTDLPAEFERVLGP
jgi:HAD superfamily hydrolase (TIGR01509 family)